MFVNHSSAAEIGTTRATINRTCKKNAAKGVENHSTSIASFMPEKQRPTYVHHLWN